LCSPALCVLSRITDEELSKISDNDEPENEPEPEEAVEGGGDKAPWPSVADLNTRLRRVISSYQRNFKREEMKLAQRAKLEKREKIEQMLRGRHHLEALRRWSRREEADFFRTVSTFGVEYDRLAFLLLKLAGFAQVLGFALVKEQFLSAPLFLT